jgi:hypothetical protein
MRQWGFLNILVGLLKKVLNTNILLASVKTFKNSETFTESRIRIIPRLTISVNSGASFTVTDGFLIASTSFLKRVTGRIFKISKCFQRSK